MQNEDIESLDQDNPTERTVKMYYFTVYTNCRSQYPWTFATKQEQAHELGSSPIPQYDNAYELPVETLSIVWIRRGDENHVSMVDDAIYEIFSGDIVCTNERGPLWLRYLYAPPVAYLPSYFIDYFVHALVEELSPVFGYNVKGQRIYHERIWGKNGKLGYAIRQDRINNNTPKPVEYDRVRLWRR
jgi:hypothetical protein